jgi:hypothetical protein
MLLPVASEWTAASYQVPSDVLAEWFDLFADGIDPLTNLTIAFVPGEVPVGDDGNPESTDGAVLWVDAVEVINDLLISVNEQNTRQLAVYPNPANNIFNIQLPEGVSTANAELRDITGKILISKNCNGRLTQVDTSTLPQGVYVLDVSGENYRAQEKIVLAN